MSIQGGPVSWGGVAACGFGAVLGLLAHRSGHDAALLRSAHRVQRLSELGAAGAALPAVVALRARADATEPLQCEHVAGLTAVITETASEQAFLKQTDTGEWVRDTVLVAHSLRDVPFYLEDDSGARVWVAGALGASGLRLATVHDSFEPTARGVVRSSVEFLRGLKLLGTRTTERALPCGALLTAVGEVARGEAGALQLRRPAVGRPFYISTRTLDELLQGLSAASRFLRLLSLTCYSAGAALLAARALQYLRTARRAAAMRRRAEEAAAARRLAAAARADADAAKPSDTDTADADEAQDQLPASQLCVICLERQHDAVFQNCGHLATCTTCAARLTKCPICRRAGPVLRIYRA